MFVLTARTAGGDGLASTAFPVATSSSRERLEGYKAECEKEAEEFRRTAPGFARFAIVSASGYEIQEVLEV